MKDISGQRFGRLIAIRPTETRKHNLVVWECICDCGNTVFITSGMLTGGNTKSCGCLRKDNCARIGAKNKQTYTKDLTGQRFGRIVAVSQTNIRKNGAVVWECKCDCGNIAYVRNALREVPDNAFLNIGNQNYGFSVDEAHYDGLSVALETKEEGVFEPVTDGKIAAAKQCLVDNGIDPDEAENILQAIGYILLNAELFSEIERKSSLPEQIHSASIRAGVAQTSFQMNMNIKEPEPEI